MIPLIARRELTELLRDGRFRWSAAVVVALLLVSLGAGWVRYRDTRAQHEAAAAAARAHWLGQEAKNPHAAAHFGVYAFKPQLPLSLVDRGVDSYTGTTAFLEAHRQKRLTLRPAQDESAAQRMGTLTAAGVLQHFLPLLIIVLAFGTFAAEREQGTMRQLLSLGVRRRDLALGKALGVTVALSLLLVPAAILGAVALVLGSSGAVAPTLGRLAVLVVAYLAYFAVFLALTLAVSARARSSRAALVLLLAFWILNGLVVPRATVDLTRWLYYTPSALGFDQTVNHELGKFDPVALERETLARYGVGRLEDLPVNFAGITLQASEAHGNEVFDRFYGELWDTFIRQERVHELASAVAPLLAVRALSMGLAGTDLEQHRHFAQAAEAYRRRMVKVINDDLAFNSRYGDVYLADRDVWEELPPFEYEAPTAAWVLANRRLSIAMLGVWLLASLLLGLAAVRRAPVD